MYVMKSMSIQEKFSNRRSLQFQALLWLSNEDALRLSLDNFQAIIKRYILSLIYFSMGGENWTTSTSSPAYFLSD